MTKVTKVIELIFGSISNVSLQEAHIVSSLQDCQRYLLPRLLVLKRTYVGETGLNISLNLVDTRIYL